MSVAAVIDRGAAYDLVNLARYNLRDAKEWRRTVQDARAELAAEGFAMLPDFVLPEAPDAMAAEVEEGLAQVTSPRT